MSDFAATVLAAGLITWAVAAWDVARKWVADRGAIQLFRRQEDYEHCLNSKHEVMLERLNVTTRALENLAKETHEELNTLRAQQVGVISGMARPRRFP